MKLMAVLACWIVALECVLRGTGDIPQATFNDGSLWLWWFFGGIWALNGVALIGTRLGR